MLVEQALVQAAAGADIVAPSDMMDGRVGAIRAGLEAAGHCDVAIMAYAAKYASAFYGPFRDAVGSRAASSRATSAATRWTPPTAPRPCAKSHWTSPRAPTWSWSSPASPISTWLAAVKQRFGVPTFAYAVSGEYAMIEAAAAIGAGDRDALILETLMAFKRAGATGVLTYHALDAARLMRD